jgi:hypothetical protein
MSRPLAFAAIAEAVTGLALATFPSLVVWVLFGAELSGVAVPVGRVAGISLFALGLACWTAAENPIAALRGMGTYSLLVTLLLLFLGVSGQWVGVALWPAVTLHAVLTLLLLREWRSNRRSRTATPQGESIHING